MRNNNAWAVLGLSVLGWAGTAGAAVTQVGDFRLSSGAVPTLTPYNAFSFATRSVTGAPVQINSAFAGTSQNYDTSAPDAATDVELQTFSSATNIRTLSRYATPALTGSGPTTAGAVAWSFDLTPLASYLSSNSLSLNSVSLLLSTTESGTTLPFDVYLSYTQPTTGMTQVGLSATSPSANYSTLLGPGHAASVGATVNNNFVVLSKGQTTADLNDDLTSLYNDGVRQFNLFAVAGSYGANVTFSVGSTASGMASGLYIDTTATPEPTMLGGLAAAGLLALRRRRA